jgi:hypothetical protein
MQESAKRGGGHLCVIISQLRSQIMEASREASHQWLQMSLSCLRVESQAQESAGDATLSRKAGAEPLAS